MKKGQRFLFATVALAVALAAFFAGTKYGEGTNIPQENLSPIAYTDILQGISYGDPTYVIGHKSPDTDTVCSAIAYAHLKQAMGIPCVPAVSAAPNNETKYVLEAFGVESPEILTDATEKSMILVDHSTYTQTVDGMENATILEILDHHGLGDVQTAQPLLIKDMPVGSTASIVYTSYLEYGIEIDKEMAGMMLSAILSDTSNLTLGTTTDLDRKAVNALSAWAEIPDVDAYYAAMEAAALSHEGMSDEEIFYSDYKEYDMNGTSVGIACVSVADAESFEDVLERMDGFMEEVYASQEMKHLYAMVTNVTDKETEILFCGDGADAMMAQAFVADEDHRYMIRPSASKKKDVVPALQKVYESER